MSDSFYTFFTFLKFTIRVQDTIRVRSECMQSTFFFGLLGYCHMRLDYIVSAQLATNHSTTDPFFLGTDNPVLRLNHSVVRYWGPLLKSHTGVC